MRNIALATLISVALGSVPAALGDAGQGEHSTGGRNVPVHRFVLRDENDESIVPAMKRAMPFSARFTCGGCHDYGKIEGGWHFNAMKSGPAGRASEPWVWVDDLTGTRLPVSYRNWQGAFRPGEIGITPWRFTQLFGRHMTGGGIRVPLDEEAMADVKGVREVLARTKDPRDRKIKPSKWQWRFEGLDPSDAAGAVDPNARWDVSGKPEINCLGCHSASPVYDQSEWARQMARENFRWAATAASELGDVGGTASLQPNTWMVSDGLSPDDTGYATPPAVTYDLGRFNAKHWAFVNVAKPRDERCLYCHSVTEADKEKWQVAGDVHSASGLTCAKCHRNDIGHKISRGYAREAADRGVPAVGELSCEGCHVGADCAAPTAGRFGAPRPKHVGLPPAHFEKLACTTCHSGPWPKQTPTRVWTSRANRMGISGIAQWRTDAPYIAEPVFMKDADGKIAPHRMMWPAFWGRLEGEKVTPLLPDDVFEAARGILDAEQQAGNVLLLLSEPLADAEAEVMPEVAREERIGGTAIMIAGGKLFRRNIDGGVDVSDYVGETAADVWWARERDGQVLPLVRGFDPAKVGTQTDPELDERILAMLRSLAAGNLGAGEPVLDCGDKVYRREITKVVKKQTDSKTKEVTTTIIYPFLIKEVTDLKRPAGRAHEPVFAWLKDGQVLPLVPEFAVDAVVQTAGIAESFTERQVAMMLEELARTKGGNYVYVSAGRAFSLGGDGGLVAGENPAAEPCAWPVAHDVRPAAQALGAVNGCKDCHSAGSPFLFARVTGAGPLKTPERMSRPMHEFEKLDVNFQRLFGFTFVFRTLFKTMLFAVACVVGIVLLAYALPAVRRLVRFAGTRE